jgi:hypothetical protein
MNDKRMAVALQLRRAIELLVQTAPLTEDEAVSVAELYEPWAAGKSYASGRILKYGADENGAANLYTVLQAHTSQEGWLPDNAPSLYKRIGFSDGGIPLWVQPLGASDAYAKGDIVSHSGVIWESDIDANVWEPGIYGWRAKG